MSDGYYAVGDDGRFGDGSCIPDMFDDDIEEEYDEVDSNDDDYEDDAEVEEDDDAEDEEYC